MPSSVDIAVDRFLSPCPPKAAQLIVTIYGDIVEPRGGVLWMGDLISLCAGSCVNESLVRTAVSRLVTKGQLAGEREGRRSFYGLTPDARDEYHLAAELFFGPEDDDCDWIVSHCPDPSDQTELIRNGFGQLDGHVFIGADRPGRPQLGTAFRSQALSPGGEDLLELAGNVFQLETLSSEYAAFVSAFAPMRELIADLPSQQATLLLRLALVHAFRDIRLRDPRLPRAVLGASWPGFEARKLFADLYRRLSDPADTYIGERLLSRNGPLPATPDAVRKRMDMLAPEP
ncbi:MAG: phenylacetic acid degradation operon negative regulatory protein PaaX [Roseibium sp.]